MSLDHPLFLNFDHIAFWLNPNIQHDKDKEDREMEKEGETKAGEWQKIQDYRLSSIYSVVHLGQHLCLPAEDALWPPDLIASLFNSLPLVLTPPLPSPVHFHNYSDPNNPDIHHDIFQEMLKRVSSSELVDKIVGCIYGHALGDAVGLATEFLTKEKILSLFGFDQFPRFVPFPDFPRNAHSRRWEDGDWTDDTDQMVLILESFLVLHQQQQQPQKQPQQQPQQQQQQPQPQELENIFASRVKYWTLHGFPELGDTCGLGTGNTVKAVTSHPDFITNPLECAEGVWLRRNKTIAANGAVMRSSIVGCYEWENMDKVVENTVNICKVTHADPRCVASCVALTSAIALSLQGSCLVGDSAFFQEIMDLSEKFIDVNDEEHNKLRDYLLSYDLQDLDLDEKKKIGYTYKCIGSAFWGLRELLASGVLNANSGDNNKNRDNENNDDSTNNDGNNKLAEKFKEILSRIIFEGGDADTNGAVCGGLLGSVVGYSNLPQDWISSLLHPHWLNQRILLFLDLISTHSS
eukprot:CAMPEP_0174255876 /NCGR_PEP_ID=MMETSP0439-20130205/5162_1 /TAXON_ID=0 /ORGANISM="Stereomyxa ramosa, Strain Chinc5" /LENGTH=519 /DNA_ID=CAMNT_0015338247 /DNA_START=213 /DNA_END=1768 /DNA_ORIENTATION=+